MDECKVAVIQRTLECRIKEQQEADEHNMIDYHHKIRNMIWYVYVKNGMIKLLMVD